MKSLAIHTITGTDIIDCESNRDPVDERKVRNTGKKGRSDGNVVTGNCEGDKIKAVIDTNEVQEINLDAKADVEQSSGNKGNERKKNCLAKFQTLRGLELHYDNDFDHKRRIDVNTCQETQSAKNSFKLSSNKQFDNLRGLWTNKCDQLQLERELAPDEQLAPVENYPDATPLGDQSAPSRYSEVEMMPTSRAAEYFSNTFSVDSQDDGIPYLVKESPWSEQPDTNLQQQRCVDMKDQHNLPNEDHYNSVVTEPCYDGENKDMFCSRYFSSNMNNSPVSCRQEEMWHRFRRNEDIADDEDNIEQPVASMYFQSN